ncbi:MAG TPA: type II toxin-antitoxin system RelE/ParE family toxin [Burkholderiaceae bacterium]|jgi:plasmid stabilization system protein ParE
MSFKVVLLPAAEQDLLQLHEHVLTRELERDGDLGLADEAVSAIEAAIHSLTRHPFICRKATDNPFLRELIIPFGRTGYVALFEIASGELVVVSAVRHQREDDYH